MNASQSMLSNQLERLAELVGRLRGLAEDVDDADGLVTGKLTVAVDVTCRRLSRLGNDLQPGLFAELPKRRRHKTAG
jgi:hypothetical protein